MTNWMLHPNNGFRLTDKGILHVSSSPWAKHDPKMMAHKLTSIIFCKTPKGLNYGCSIIVMCLNSEQRASICHDI